MTIQNAPTKKTTLDVKEQRLQQWEEKKAKNPSFHFMTKPDHDKSIIANPECKASDIEQHASMTAATGSACVEYSTLLLSQAANGFFNRTTIADTANAIHGALLSLEPGDEIEGMLITRMLVIHDQYMNFLARSSNPEATTIVIDNNINRSTKLMRVYNETLDTLNKYRRKGEQKVTVQHVNVENGGQAVVGNTINTGGSNEKS